MTRDELGQIVARRTKAELTYSIRVTAEAAPILKSPMVDRVLAQMQAELASRL